jgi:hypothetical protein
MMKKIVLLVFVTIMFASCGPAKIQEAVVVEQINILENKDYKYEIKLHTMQGSDASAYYYTNFRHQVGDTLLSYYEYFSGKGQQVSTLQFEVDSLKKELQASKYYLRILEEKVIFDTIRKK